MPEKTLEVVTQLCSAITEVLNRHGITCRLSVEMDAPRPTPMPEDIAPPRSEVPGRPTRALLRTKGEIMVSTWNKQSALYPDRMNQIRFLSEKRLDQLVACVEERSDFEALWYQALTKIPLKGSWQPNFDWLLDVTNVAKVIEGTYDRAFMAPSKPKQRKLSITERLALAEKGTDDADTPF